MTTIVHPSVAAQGRAAADAGVVLLREILAEQETATIALAAGSSQFAMLEELTVAPDLPWHRIRAFPLNEYVGLPVVHPSSSRRFLWERFESQLPLPLRAFYHIDGVVEDPTTESVRVGRLLRDSEIDVAFIGIGENGHLAFNDPPADFDTEEPYIVVELDERCRQQQKSEGWFDTLDDVPHEAISMSVHRMMTSRHLICSVPDKRKAEAVQAAVEGEVTSRLPASILQQHENCQLFLDEGSASLLK